MKRAVVIAHFHARGVVPRNLRNLIAHLGTMSERLVFVSTGAADEELRSLPTAVTILTRPNVGFDFASYRVGIESLGDLSGLDQLVLLNSSFITLDPRKLCDAFFGHPPENVDLLGLTATSDRGTFHLQSFLLAFGRQAIASDAFGRWWHSVEALADKEEVIRRYEVGMSSYFLGEGLRLAPVFSPSDTQRFHALCRWLDVNETAPEIRPDGTAVLNVREADRLNPMHFLWDAVFARFGIVKAELMKRNPHSIDLRRLNAMFRGDPAFRHLVEDVLDG